MARNLLSLLLASALGISSAAAAVTTIATGPVGSPNENGTASCRAVNLGSTPEEITIDVYNQNGVLLQSDAEVIAPRSTLQRSAIMESGGAAYCIFGFTGAKRDLRGELCVIQSVQNRHYCVSAR